MGIPKSPIMSRKYTDYLLMLVDEGRIDKDHVINCCTRYMSEYDVRDMMESNEIISPGLLEDEDEDTILEVPEDWSLRSE